VVNTVAMNTAHGRALAVIPASRRLSMRLVRRVMGDQHARLATEDELQSHFAECELGALPPLGSLLNASTYVDPEVLEHHTVVFAAGSQTESVKARTRDLFREGEVTVAPLTTQPEQGDEEPIAT
jgi:Ala-tRNA(Pro) deacylase